MAQLNLTNLQNRHQAARERLRTPYQGTGTRSIAQLLQAVSPIIADTVEAKRTGTAISQLQQQQAESNRELGQQLFGKPAPQPFSNLISTPQPAQTKARVMGATPTGEKFDYGTEEAAQQAFIEGTHPDATNQPAQATNTVGTPHQLNIQGLLTRKAELQNAFLKSGISPELKALITNELQNTDSIITDYYKTYNSAMLKQRALSGSVQNKIAELEMKLKYGMLENQQELEFEKQKLEIKNKFAMALEDKKAGNEESLVRLKHELGMEELDDEQAFKMVMQDDQQEFQGYEASLDRAAKEELQLGQQAFTTQEREAAEAFKAGQANQDHMNILSRMEAQGKIDLNKLAEQQAFTTSEREASQDFKTTAADIAQQNVLERLGIENQYATETREDEQVQEENMKLLESVLAEEKAKKDFDRTTTRDTTKFDRDVQMEETKQDNLINRLNLQNQFDIEGDKRDLYNQEYKANQELEREKQLIQFREETAAEFAKDKVGASKTDRFTYLDGTEAEILAEEWGSQIPEAWKGQTLRFNSKTGEIKPVFDLADGKKTTDQYRFLSGETAKKQAKAWGSEIPDEWQGMNLRFNMKTKDFEPALTSTQNKKTVAELKWDKENSPQAIIKNEYNTVSGSVKVLNQIDNVERLAELANENWVMNPFEVQGAFKVPFIEDATPLWQKSIEGRNLKAAVDSLTAMMTDIERQSQKASGTGQGGVFSEGDRILLQDSFGSLAVGELGYDEFVQNLADIKSRWETTADDTLMKWDGENMTIFGQKVEENFGNAENINDVYTYVNNLAKKSGKGFSETDKNQVVNSITRTLTANFGIMIDPNTGDILEMIEE